MTRRRVTVLGAGLIGRAMVFDLCREHEVTVADVSAESLEFVSRWPCRTVQADVLAPGEMERIAGDAELVLSAMPGALGMRVLERLIAMGKDVVDISFTEEDPTALNALAAARGATVIVDCGVCPGLSNIAAAHAARRRFARLDRYVCYVGGLPREPRPPWYYKNPFAAESVIDEYTRPCRFRIGGEPCTLEPLSGAETVEFAETGPLTAFHTDGIRTLLASLPEVPTLVEKTLRHPQHYEFVVRLREAGFFAPDILPALTTVARRAWRFEPGEADLTVMRLLFEGLSPEGAPVRLAMDLIDHYDAANGLLSMARTTGFTATAAARLLLEGRFRRPGVHPPEVLGLDEDLYQALTGMLDERGVRFTESVERLAGA
ncbi:MAG: saccharopine dehydrogenase C-terminal domain-containing protein [Bryobacteraceae bacterium]